MEASPGAWWRAPTTFRWFALAQFVATILITLTGAAVRLTGSGLGCPDWPTCHRRELTGPLNGHALIEYGNRAVTGLLVLLTLVVLLNALTQRPFRRDLVNLTLALVGGIVANALLGPLIVYSKLNPWLVSLHLLLSLLVVVMGATLYHHSKYLYGAESTAHVRDVTYRRLARLLWVPLVLVLFAGTLTAGSGPHPGSFVGQLIAKRVPLAFSTAALVHASAVIVLLALLLALFFRVHSRATPEPVRLGVRRLLLISLAQGALGVIQYLAHVPAWLVELHVLGAISLTIGVTQFNLRQVARVRVAGTRRAR